MACCKLPDEPRLRKRIGEQDNPTRHESGFVAPNAMDSGHSPTHLPGLLAPVNIADFPGPPRRAASSSSSSPCEERAGRGPRRGETNKNAPPLPSPLLHPMEEREKSRSLMQPCPPRAFLKMS